MTRLLTDSSGQRSPSATRPHDNDSSGLGALLRRARNDLGLTLEQISNETRIPRRHLEALEHNNLAAVPSGFYRRAEIRAYARAVNLDQNLALTELDRAEALPETPRNQGPTFSRKRVLIVIGVVAAAAMFARAMTGRDPAFHGNGQDRTATGSPQSSVPLDRKTPPDAVVETSQPAPLDQVTPLSAPASGAQAVAMEPTGVQSTASNGDSAVTTEQAEAPASAGIITELVVTTEPVGARVTVNGIGWGITPITIRHLPAGDKRIRVSKDGYATEERTVTLAAGRLRMLDIRLSSAP